ncbi:MAG: ABC transporter permease [Pseudomonadota bacterium]
MILDAEIVGVVWLSLKVSLIAAFIGLAFGAPAGAWICMLSKTRQRIWLAVFSTLLAVPTVVVGLLVYMLLSRSGPLGALELLFTPTAIIFAQALITLPVVTVFAYRACAEPWADYGEALRLDIRERWKQGWHLLRMARAGIVMAFLVAFGRAVSEVGAVMIVGGNIRGATRVMTTAITLETRQGNFSFAVALGLILLAISFLVTLATWAIARGRGEKL